MAEPEQDWIRSFFKGQTQRVVVDGETSDAVAVKSGMPQGSVLGPLLFLIFLNDLAEHTSSTVRLFADDCVMYRHIANVHDCKVLQEDLHQLHEWEERWQLKFNKAKCNIMRATHARQKKIVFRYELDGVLLKDTDSTSYLGVELSADMKWNSHVKKVTAKRNTMLGILRRNLKNCPKNLKDLAYKSILRPKLEYACSISQQTLVCHFSSVVQATSESSANQLKVGKTSESNQKRIFGNNSDDCKGNQCSSSFQVILWNNFSAERLIKVVWIDVHVYTYAYIYNYD